MNTRSANRLAIAAIVAFVGCARTANFFRVDRVGWSGNSIVFHIRQTDTIAGREVPTGIELDCLNCNEVQPPAIAQFDSLSVEHATIAEANYLTAVRLHISGRGIDTTLTLRERSGDEAVQFYKLSRPLIGRVLVPQFAILYGDSALTQSLSHSERGDELNLYDETPFYFVIQHPLFAQALYLPRSSGIRLR